MTNGEQGVAPAGWYPNGEVLRYWDGKAWTEHTVPLEQQGPPVDKRAGKEAAKAQGAAAKEAKAAQAAAAKEERELKAAAAKEEREKKAAAARAERENKAAAAKAEREAKLAALKQERAALKGAKESDPLRPDIEAAMSKMSYKSGSKREVKRLADHLWHDEQVSLITGGTYGPGTGIVVLTDRRLFFLKDGLMSKTSEDFPLDKISSVQWSTGMLLGKITVFASGNKAEITNVQKADGKAITDAVRARLAGGSSSKEAPPAPAPAPAPPTVAATDDVYERLKKLGDLRDAGILTDEEFAAKKQVLLEQL
jgi:hypothetical protein